MFFKKGQVYYIKIQLLKNCLRKRSFRHILCLHQYEINQDKIMFNKFPEIKSIKNNIK